MRPYPSAGLAMLRLKPPRRRSDPHELEAATNKNSEFWSSFVAASNSWETKPDSSVRVLIPVDDYSLPNEGHDDELERVNVEHGPYRFGSGLLHLQRLSDGVGRG